MCIANRRFICVLAVLSIVTMLFGCGALGNTEQVSDRASDMLSASIVNGVSDYVPDPEDVKDVSEEIVDDDSNVSSDAVLGLGNSELSNDAHTCTLTVRCDTLLSHSDELSDGVAEILPADGFILHETDVNFKEGDSVFDILLDVTSEKKIHMEFSKTPAYDSAYIEGIANIYEFDCGSLSGWMYSVNGKFPNCGCSRYEVKDGDKIEWVYSCDLGRDVGNEI